MLREKIHHLDDMLKSQQRKVRQMIEQVREPKSREGNEEENVEARTERAAGLWGHKFRLTPG